MDSSSLFSLNSSLNSLEVSLNTTFDSVDIPTDGVVPKSKSFFPNLPDDFIDKLIGHYLKHNTTLVCLEDFMTLWNVGRDDCDQLPTRKQKIMALFREGRDLPKIFYFVKCGTCQKRTKIDSESATKVKCCDKILKKSETNFFVYLPIESQIIQSIEKNWSYIKTFDTSSKNNNSYSDAHDGRILREILKQYEDSNLNILSLSLNVDGANKYKSNNLSLWPIQLVQNYLPPDIRYRTENIIVAGLYYNNVKVNIREYMLPLVDELNQLKGNPIQMKIENGDYTFKPVVTHGVFDLPAKSLMNACKQFGGYNACTYCEIPGELVIIEKKKDEKNNTKKGKGKKIKKMNEDEEIKHVRYVEGSETYKLRDEAETLAKMLLAFDTKKTVDGIKDLSCLVALEHFNIVLSIGVEYMHCILLGVEKRMTNFFMNSRYSTKEFYITPKRRKILNKRILSIKPPSFVVRKPRSLEQRANFKASEYRFMLLYYLPVCLIGLVPKVYIAHVRLLSGAVYILLQSNIPHSEVDDAEEKLIIFVKQHQELFGKQNMVMVIHLLKHLAQSVRELGPLWTHSAFPFEKFNGVLLKMGQGTTDLLLQISSKYALSKTIIKKKENSSTCDSILLGKSVEVMDKSLCVLDIVSLKKVNFSNVTLCVHKRIKWKKVIYTSLSYTRPKKSIDYFIGLLDDKIGMAKFYIERSDKIYVVIKEFEIIDYIDHIWKVQSTGTHIMAPIDHIQTKFVYMKVGLHQYVASEPNPYEIE